MSLVKALDALRSGKLIAVWDADDREGEADLMFHASAATPEKVKTLRRDAGGLICLAVDGTTAEKLGLEFFSDVFQRGGAKLAHMDCKKTAYGDKPAFSIAINHKNVFTGITDNDRSLTIGKFAEVAANGDRNAFTRSFYTPGHVFLLIGRGINKRKGHTELSLELAKKAKLPGAVVMCEMLGSGKALSKDKVIAYCKKNKIEFTEGRDIYE